jgi:signal transduction histidine kinase
LDKGIPLNKGVQQEVIEIASDSVATAPRGVSLRIKGAVVFGIMILYAALLTSYGFHQKDQLLSRFLALQDLHESEGALRQADLAAFHEMAGLFLMVDLSRELHPARIRAHLTDLKRQHDELVLRYPEIAPNIHAFSAALNGVLAEPTAINVRIMRAGLEQTKTALTALAAEAHAKQKLLAAAYRVQGNRAAVVLLLLGLLGAIIFGAIAAIFFARLTGDLTTLSDRALAVVRGYRGEPLHESRTDEVGQLITSINNMAVELDNREKELDLERQKYFHQEKMAAVGTLAAGIVHEIGNPIAAITGLVEEIRHNGDQMSTDELSNMLGLILEHTERLASINRDVSEFSMPHYGERQLVDLNGLVGTTTRLMRHDSRLRPVEMNLTLDKTLPAITCVGDQIIQVIMNVLINAADALADVPVDDRRISILTRTEQGRVALEIEDNGKGMAPEIRAKVFEAFYTTKAPGRGTGLGLSLCYSVVSEHGGSIEIESEIEKGTRVIIRLPAETEFG